MKFVVEALLGEPRHVAAHDARIHAELRLHELRAGVDLGLRAPRLPAGRRIDRIVGAAEEKIEADRRPCGRSAVRLCRAAAARSRAAGADRDRRPAWRRAGRPRSDRRRATSADCARPDAAALSRSLCNAMRLRSRQVNCSTGSMPCSTRIAAAVTAPRCGRAPAPSVTLTASARPLSGSALASSSPRSADTGGVTSAVMTKRPARNLSCKVVLIGSKSQNPVDLASATMGKMAAIPRPRSCRPQCFNRRNPSTTRWRHRRRLHAGGSARGFRRADGGNARADQARRKAAASRGAADVEPAGRSADRRRLRRNAGDERGEPGRVRPGAALHRRGDCRRRSK